MTTAEIGPAVSETLAKARTEEMGHPASEPSSSPQLSPSSRASTPQHSPLPREVMPRAEVMPHPKRNNTVTHVMLHGIPIVCLMIDAKERLCLAQISNTLLKAYSYNEIHNRRVALGITCVQCTPVQLEILRRAGAMPISSRRCGMITKREAERLVKSFLEDTTPPKLPENFAFDVSHDCGWGCRGNFVPSRYNSSRAKCIKCAYCNMFFSPNKFIFHFHRTPEGSYNHPDAANFNSWRRHLKLTGPNASEDLSHAWEDVKAMFNGGSRKRVINSYSPSSSPSDRAHSVSNPSTPLQDSSKRPKLSPDSSTGPLPVRPHITSGHPPYHYPVLPVPSKMMPGMKGLPGQPPFGIPYPFEKSMMMEQHDGFKSPGQTAPPSWSGMHETLYPPYEMIWAKHLGLPGAETAMPPLSYPRQGDISPKSRSQFVINTSGSSFSPNSSSSSSMYGGQHHHEGIKSGGLRRGDYDHVSAFKPVGGGHAGSPSPPALRSYTPERSTRSVSPQTVPEAVEEDSDNEENVDVDTIDDEPMMDHEQNNNDEGKPQEPEEMDAAGHSNMDRDDHLQATTESERSDSPVHSHNDDHTDTVSERRDSTDLNDDEKLGHPEPSPSPEREERVSTPNSRTEEAHTCKEESQKEQEAFKQDSAADDDDDKSDSVLSDRQHMEELSKEQLQRELELEIKARKRMEEDCRTIKETFQEQVEREKQYREEMAKQLQIVRETLCHELDQERKVRFSLQQKLKEAHDALHNFSCKMLASRQCSECTPYEKPILPR